MGQEVTAGTQIAGYRLEEEIGRGGMGVVYRAHDVALERSVALKLLSPSLAEDRDFRERFLVESRLAASLEHPNVVPIHDAGEADGQLYLAMRYVEGTDLKRLLHDEGPLEPARAIAICSQIADALDAAHARGLVHRDVKPSNVLLDEHEHAYLADFGLTRRLADQAPGFEAGLSLGTPAYVAPEQIEGKEVDGRADQYSLACLLHECLTGEPPFPRGSEAATLFAHLEEATARAGRTGERAAQGARKGSGGALRELRGCSPAGAHRAFLRPGEGADDDGSPRPSSSLQPWVPRSASSSNETRIQRATAHPRSPRPRSPVRRSATCRPITRSLWRLAGPSALRAWLSFACVPGTRGCRVLPGRGTSRPHHDNLEQGLSDGSRDRPVLDGRGDEGGLRGRRAAVAERHPDGKKVFQWVVGDNLVLATGAARKLVHAVALYEGNPNNTLGGSPQAYAGYVAAVETSCKIR